MSNEHGTQGQAPAPDDAAAIARTFTEARRAGSALPAFPGAIPTDLVGAYQVQDRAIDRWDDQVIGWKVGYIAAERRDGSGDERLLGPIFKRQLWNDTGRTTDIPVFVGGFGAVEAEYVLELLEDAPAGQLHWSPEQAEALPARLYIGVEVASSPLATINELGPRVVVSDFGNNNGLVLGPEIADWTARDETSLRAETLIEGDVVGTGGATRLPGGLRAAYAFALSRSALRGRPLRKGDLIATGNATGIHDITVGQTALVRFAGFGDIACRAVPAG
ncbi:2-keto-4-pentenoate hydratase [Stenotrophomonas maltophilia]|uniref:2-keto-4-pentenoate hydratase n=1 Tax=Stenotrophomonas maltophilia group TaxID=995085 RepID=UPI000D0CC4B6|nr:2-keto-4-pentenoate hydratase [Stenotrophomonas maltophilia]PSM14848.1 2-keto-4-pentenoate hydratase [Stenotrophomonas maltophilia]RRU71858.1 2-keto-4-pentenoate hydratase [Stenotrophomonas maltophilia]